MGFSGLLLILVPFFETVPALIAFAICYGLVAGSYVAMIAVMLAESLGRLINEEVINIT